MKSITNFHVSRHPSLRPQLGAAVAQHWAARRDRTSQRPRDPAAARPGRGGFWRWEMGDGSEHYDI